eukprot:3837124-Alexandrium_andersonii.AAC.1
MSASLVGSEMCIRDSWWSFAILRRAVAATECARGAAPPWAAFELIGIPRCGCPAVAAPVTEPTCL